MLNTKNTKNLLHVNNINSAIRLNYGDPRIIFKFYLLILKPVLTFSIVVANLKSSSNFTITGCVRNNGFKKH